VILVDANILLYAEDSLSPHHARAREWWDERLSGADPVCLAWPTLTAFLRIATNPRLHRRPLTRREAVTRIQSWLDQPCVRVVGETDAHWRTFRALVDEGDATGNLVMDAHLGALAIENGCRLCSSDGDFARFPSLDWCDPLG